MATIALLLLAGCFAGISHAQPPGSESNNVAHKSFFPGEVWTDANGDTINAHGGGILYTGDRYYWFGEKRGRGASQGVNVYSSSDLYTWKHEGLALSQHPTDTTSDIARGCVMERPKVIYNDKTRKYVMWFHLELRGKGYNAARTAVAVSDVVTGPYTFLYSFRPNGNMSRDMTLFKDGEQAAYLVYSSRDNYDLRIVKLTDDFLQVTSEDKLLFSNHREAPALFFYNKHYYLITSGCTGWKPNKATIHQAGSVWGPWRELSYNPMVGPKAETTFEGQSTYVLPVNGKKDWFIFLADKWNPGNLRDSRYLWLPVQFKEGRPVVGWLDKWDLSFFRKPDN